MRQASQLLAIVLFACSTVWAHVGDTIYPIYELPPSQLPDLHDGTLEDWEEALPNASLTQNDVWSFTGESDVPFRMYLAWSHAEQRLYLGFERIDEFFVDGRETFGLEIDGDHSGGSTWYPRGGDTPSDAELSALESNGQTYFYVPRGDVHEIASFDGTSLWARLPPYADFGVTNVDGSPGHTTLEMMLTPWDRLDPEGPEASRQSELIPGKIIGLMFNIVDTKEDGSINVFAPSMVANRYDAGEFADGELLSCHLPGCSGQATTAVQRDSWARIKIGLR